MPFHLAPLFPMRTSRFTLALVVGAAITLGACKGNTGAGESPDSTQNVAAGHHAMGTARPGMQIPNVTVDTTILYQQIHLELKYDTETHQQTLHLKWEGGEGTLDRTFTMDDLAPHPGYWAEHGYFFFSPKLSLMGETSETLHLNLLAGAPHSDDSQGLDILLRANQPKPLVLPGNYQMGINTSPDGHRVVSAEAVANLLEWNQKPLPSGPFVLAAGFLSDGFIFVLRDTTGAPRTQRNLHVLTSTTLTPQDSAFYSGWGNLLQPYQAYDCHDGIALMLRHPAGTSTDQPTGFSILNPNTPGLVKRYELSALRTMRNPSTPAGTVPFRLDTGLDQMVLWVYVEKATKRPVSYAWERGEANQPS